MTEDNIDAQLSAAIATRNSSSDVVTVLALKSLGVNLRKQFPSARYLELTEGDQSETDVVFHALLDADDLDVLDTEGKVVDWLDDEDIDSIMQLEDWRLHDMVGPEKAPTFVTVRLSGRTPYWRIDLEKAAELEAPISVRIAVPDLDERGEVVVQLANGCTLRSGVYDQNDPDAFTSGEYVRLCGPDGSEIRYWDQEEWATDPALVMGAIINSAATGS